MGAEREELKRILLVGSRKIISGLLVNGLLVTVASTKKIYWLSSIPTVKLKKSKWLIMSKTEQRLLPRREWRMQKTHQVLKNMILHVKMNRTAQKKKIQTAFANGILP